jgi:hypothetical protein
MVGEYPNRYLDQKTRHRDNEKKELMKGNPGSGLCEANQVDNCNYIDVATLTVVVKAFV